MRVFWKNRVWTLKKSLDDKKYFCKSSVKKGRFCGAKKVKTQDFVGLEKGKKKLKKVLYFCWRILKRCDNICRLRQKVEAESYSKKEIISADESWNWVSRRLQKTSNAVFRKVSFRQSPATNHPNTMLLIFNVAVWHTRTRGRHWRSFIK